MRAMSFALAYCILFGATVTATAAPPPDETGYECWLRYQPVTAKERLAEYRRAIGFIVRDEDHALVKAAIGELETGLSKLLDRPVPIQSKPADKPALIVGTSASKLVERLISADDRKALGPEGYLLRAVESDGQPCLVIAGNSERGLIYGAFHFLRLIQTESSLKGLNIAQQPANSLRLVNMWDNVERDRDADGNPVKSQADGKSSPNHDLRENSIWKWDELPKLNARYTDYARLLASVGINGVVINNVNTSKHGLTGWKLLTEPYIGKLAALSAAFRPYGVRLYLSIGFNSPMLIDGFKTADPKDPQVEQWWNHKAEELYAQIPDFGGYLVKADSEQEPGPLAYGRTHAEGANMLASTLNKHAGIVMWRAFVYGSTLKDFPKEVRDDRARQAYDFFHAQDGQFADNVVLQVKHGPIDFGLREPASSLFGAMPQTNLLMEGFDFWYPTGRDASVCYLAPMWKWVLDFDMEAKGPGSTIKRTISGELNHRPLGGSAAMIVIGDVPSWTAQPLHQANIYGYGRLAWDPDVTLAAMTQDWVRQTFGNDPAVIATISEILLESWNTVADYMTPLGLPGPLTGKESPVPAERATYSGVYPAPEKRTKMTGADAKGVGFDRTVATGSKYIAQYSPAVASKFESVETCPLSLMLFFHHLPYTFRLRTGQTVVQSLYDTYFDAAEKVESMGKKWETLEGHIDNARYRDVLERLHMQAADAKVWRDTMTAYFLRLSGIADEKGRVHAAGKPVGN